MSTHPGHVAIPDDGDLAVVALPLVLQSLADRRETGILTVQGEADIVAVSFHDGAIVAADALNQTVEEGLGKVLVARELIDASTFSSLAGEHQGGRDGTLADLLVARELITRGQLLECLRLQTCEQLFGLLSWQRGDYKFYSGDEVSYEDGMMPIAVEELLVDAIEQASDGDAPQVAYVYRQSPAVSPLRLIGQDEPGEDTAIWLTLEEHAVWQQTDGERPAAEVMPALRPRRLQFVLHRLLQLGLLEEAPSLDARSHQVGATEIFVPPSPDDELEASAVRRPKRDWKPVMPWLAAAIAAVALVAVVRSGGQRPSLTLLAFPWQDVHRDAVEHQLRQSRLDAVEAAARSYFLMEQRFPESLISLVDLRLVGTDDLRGPAGHPVKYTLDSEVSGRLIVEGDGQLDQRALTVEDDDFLLGDILVQDLDARTAPLYLID